MIPIRKALRTGGGQPENGTDAGSTPDDGAAGAGKPAGPVGRFSNTVLPPTDRK
ncbi:MAG: hypothetical protein ACLVAW_10305 [Eisenbergiella massiliensis]